MECKVNIARGREGGMLPSSPHPSYPACCLERQSPSVATPTVALGELPTVGLGR